MTAAPDLTPDGACAEVRFFCEYWAGLKGEAHLPACDLIDPVDFSPYLSRVFIVEGRCLEELTVRLAGTVYRELYGFEITGKRLADIIPFRNRRDLMEDYGCCLHDQRPIYRVGSMDWRARGSEVSFQRILLPFGDDRGVERVLGFAQFFDIDGTKLFR